MQITYEGGYVAAVDYDADQKLFTGRILNLRDHVHFTGRSVDELEESFHESLEVYLGVCREEGKEPEKPYGGNIMVRGTPAWHRLVAIAAAHAGARSINAWAVEALEAAAKREVEG